MANIFRDRLTATTCLILVLAGVGVSYQNCSKVGVSDLPNDPAVVDLGNPPPVLNGNLKFDISETPQYICSPFGDTSGGGTERSGLRAELAYISSGSTRTGAQKNAVHAVEYFTLQDADIIHAKETVYLSDVNVPNRQFTEGFKIGNGQYLMDNKGVKLGEYFALKMDSILKLSDSDPEGYYELATISDDGSLVQIMENGNWVTVVDNDTPHSPRMACGVNGKKIRMTKESRIPIRIYYNQAPYDQIAMVLSWNYRGPDATPSASVASDADIHLKCGAVDRIKWWKMEDSSPQEYYNYIVSKGWKVPKPANFQLPGDEVNPCAFDTKYAANPQVSYESISDFNKRITISTEVSTILTVKLSKVDASGNSVTVKTVNQPLSQVHTFDTGDLELNAKYIVEVIFEIPSQNVRIIKSWNMIISDPK